MTRLRLALAALALVGIASFTAWFLSRFERGTERRWTGYTGEARENRYHALRRLLERYGADVRAIDAVEELAALPASDATLILPTQRDTLPVEVSARLRAWVESGGHLVVVIWTLHGESGPGDPLLDPLDLRQFHDPQAGEADASREDSPALTEVRLDGRPLAIAFDPHYSMQDAGVQALGRLSGTYGTHALWYSLGRGRLSVFTDLEFLTNDALRGHDHGEFALRYFDRRAHPGPVWIAYAERHRSLWLRLARRAWAVGVALALLLLLALWRAAPRFGPLLPAPSRARRQLAEHLDAAGRHGWRWDRGGALLAAVQAALRHELARRQPELLRGAERLDLEAQRVERALGDERVSDPADFTERVRSLELLRRGR